MKSISAKHAPQMSPCLPIRVRHTMQTGGSSKSASEQSDRGDQTEGTLRRLRRPGLILR